MTIREAWDQQRLVWSFELAAFLYYRLYFNQILSRFPIFSPAKNALLKTPGLRFVRTVSGAEPHELLEGRWKLRPTVLSESSQRDEF